MLTVPDGIINLNYGQVDLGSIKWLYDKPTDKMIVHIPFAVVSKYLYPLGWSSHNRALFSDTSDYDCRYLSTLSSPQPHKLKPSDSHKK